MQIHVALASALLLACNPRSPCCDAPPDCGMCLDPSTVCDEGAHVCVPRPVILDLGAADMDGSRVQ